VILPAERGHLVLVSRVVCVEMERRILEKHVMMAMIVMTISVLRHAQLNTCIAAMQEGMNMTEVFALVALALTTALKVQAFFIHGMTVTMLK
jgi:hypothetical protein